MQYFGPLWGPPLHLGMAIEHPQKEIRRKVRTVKCAPVCKVSARTAQDRWKWPGEKKTRVLKRQKTRIRLEISLARAFGRPDLFLRRGLRPPHPPLKEGALMKLTPALEVVIGPVGRENFGHN
jgi:hypothetical protein